MKRIICLLFIVFIYNKIPAQTYENGTVRQKTEDPGHNLINESSYAKNARVVKSKNTYEVTMKTSFSSESHTFTKVKGNQYKDSGRSDLFTIEEDIKNGIFTMSSIENKNFVTLTITNLEKLAD